VAAGSLAFMTTGVVANLLENAGYVSAGIARAEILLLGLASFLVVLQSGSAAVEKLMAKRKLLNLIGAASFSIYLIHQPAISLFRKIVEWFGWQGWLGSPLFFPLAAMVGVVVGIAMYLLLERPMLRYLSRRFVKGKRVASRPPLVAAALTPESALKPRVQVSVYPVNDGNR
jgi:peptidoglycan/LPS O-acetylase OafA/YrhL